MVTKFKPLVVIFSLVVISLVSWQSIALEKLVASIDRNPVMERESFILKIQFNDSVNTNDLDLSELYSIGFVVGRTATGSQTQIINGSIEKSTTWSIVLTAKKVGKYTIPAFSLNGAKSQPIQVEVVKGVNNNALKNQDIFIKNTLEETDIYVQQTIKLTTKLFISPQVELQSGSLSEPKLEGAFIQQQGKDRDSSEIINGIRYRVIERIYTITPQASGKFTISSPTFSGDVTSKNHRRSMFSTFTQSKPVNSFGDDFEINVKPIPDDYVGVWLPSTIVQLNEEWQPNKDTFEIGEAITRTITLTALNVNEEQLPELDITYPDSVKVYPDQSDSASVIRQSSLVSQRTMSEAIIPNQAGKITLPAVEVSWFNTILKREQKATLPAKVITVVPPANGVLSPLNQPNLQTASASSANLELGEGGNKISAQSVQLQFWHLLVMGSGWIVAFVITVIYWRSRRYSGARAYGATGSSIKGAVNPSVSFNINELKSACLANQVNQSHRMLEAWLHSCFPHTTSINQVMDELTPELQAEINVLLSHRYASKSAEHWRGATLWQAIEGQLENMPLSHKEMNTGLPPLN